MLSLESAGARHTEAVRTLKHSRQAGKDRRRARFSCALLAALTLAGCAGGPAPAPGAGSPATAAPATAAPASAAAGGSSATAGGPASGKDYSDAGLQSLLQSVQPPGGGQLQPDDPRAVASGALGDYHDVSDPKRGIVPGRCELFESYLMLNAADGALASVLLVPSTAEDQNAMKMTGTYRSVTAVHPAAPGARSEFRQRLEAYSTCSSVRELSLLPANRQMELVRLEAKVSAGESFAVSQLTADAARIGANYVGASKDGVDVIYRQSVNGAAATTLDADAAAREGADVVNQVLAKLP